MKNKIYFGLLVLIFISCNSQTNVNICHPKKESYININLNDYLDNEMYQLEDIIESEKLLFLETNDNCLVGNIRDYIITDSRIFIWDDFERYGLIIFDRNGKFIKRLPFGNGPGEISRIVGIGYNHYTSQLIIIQNPFIQIYDLNGEFIKSIQLDFPINSLEAVLPDGYIFSKVYGHKCDIIENIENYAFVETDLDFNIKQLLMPYNYKLPITVKASQNNDEIICFSETCDTIYYFQNDSLFSKYKLDYSSKKIDYSNLNSDYDYFNLEFDETKNFIILNKFLETQNHIFISFNSGHNQHSVFINKKKWNIINGYGYYFPTDKILPLNSPTNIKNDTLISIMEPISINKNFHITSTNYYSQEDIKRIENLESDDNPFFILFTLKDFKNYE